MREKLEKALGPESMEIVDESHLHAGHSGARPEGNSHFRVEIVSAAFEGKSRVERQRMVYGILSEEFTAGLHALSVKAAAPGEKP